MPVKEVKRHTALQVRGTRCFCIGGHDTFARRSSYDSLSNGVRTQHKLNDVVLGTWGQGMGWVFNNNDAYEQGACGNRAHCIACAR